MMKNFLARMDKLIEAHSGRGVNENAATPIIVSVTSYPPRMPRAHIALFSLLTQSVMPQKVILWLAGEEFPNRERDIPAKVLSLVKNGLEIRWTNNIRSYKKLVPALAEFGDRLIVTADDDIFYPPHWLKALLDDYEAHGRKRMIHAHLAHRITFDTEGYARAYLFWRHFIDHHAGASLTHFGTTGGGVLFPPRSLHPDVLREDLFMRLAPTADDVFFWAMAVMNGTPIKVVPNRILPNVGVGVVDDVNPLWKTNVIEMKNDEYLKNLVTHYPDIALKIQDAWRKEHRNASPV